MICKFQKELDTESVFSREKNNLNFFENFHEASMMNSKHLLNSNYPSNVFETYFLKDFRVCPEEISFLKAGYKYLKAGNRLVSLN